MFPEVHDYNLEELQELFKGTLREAKVSDDDQELWLQEVAIQIAKTGAKGVVFLLPYMQNGDEQRVRAALLAMSFVNHRQLSSRNRAKVCQIAMNALDDPRPLVVAEAVDTLCQLKCEVDLARIDPLLKHDSPYVVGSALRFFARRYPEKAVPILEDALASPEPIVRQNAIDELDDMGWRDSLPKIERLLEDPDKDVRQAARTAVANLASTGN